MHKNKHPIISTGDIHHDAYKAAQETRRVAIRRGNRLQQAGAVAGLLTTLGTGTALATHQPKAEVAVIATAGSLVAGGVEKAKKDQQRVADDAGSTADAAAANRIIAAGPQNARAPLWATEHIHHINAAAAMPLGSLASARTIEHAGMVLSSDGSVALVNTPRDIGTPQHPRVEVKA